MKNIALIILAILHFNSYCISQGKKLDSTYYVDQSGNWVVKRKPDNKIVGEKYFQYDNIELFHRDLKFSKVQNLYFDLAKSEMDSIKKGVYFENIPKDILDSSIFYKLEEIGYKKLLIDKSKFNEIDQIFVEKATNTNEIAFCINVYRDILIFKNKNKIVGIAKVCFECSANVIVGTLADTKNFGQDGDYAKLKDILRKK